MEKFQANKLDLDLELITLDGVKVPLSPKVKTNTSMIIKIMKDFKKLEDKDDDKNPMTPFDIIAIELAMIYPKDSQWFLDNLDPVALKDIIKYVAQTMGGVQKNASSST